MPNNRFSTDGSNLGIPHEFGLIKPQVRCPMHLTTKIIQGHCDPDLQSGRETQE